MYYLHIFVTFMYFCFLLAYSKDEKNKIVKVNIIHRECDYLLCILKHDEIYQVSLNLMFDEGEKVIFFIEGRGKNYIVL